MIRHETKWGIDKAEFLPVIADELHLKVSYAIFSENQYIFSRLTLAGKMLYCACRISGETLKVIGRNEHEISVCLADPTSIVVLEKALKDDNFMLEAGPTTEQRILAGVRDNCDLDLLIEQLLRSSH